MLLRYSLILRSNFHRQSVPGCSRMRWTATSRSNGDYTNTIPVKSPFCPVCGAILGDVRALLFPSPAWCSPNKKDNPTLLHTLIGSTLQNEAPKVLNAVPRANAEDWPLNNFRSRSHSPTDLSERIQWPIQAPHTNTYHPQGRQNNPFD